MREMWPCAWLSAVIPYMYGHLPPDRRARKPPVLRCTRISVLFGVRISNAQALH